MLEQEKRNLLKFPAARGHYLPVGPVSGRLKQVEVKPYYGDFLVICIFETGEDCAPLPICASCGIDLGVDNTAALVSSNGRCVLYKGGALKSANQWYNKQMADYRSLAMKGHTPKEAAKLDLLHTKKMQALSRRRNQFFHDTMHKIASDIVKFCLDTGITTIVLGKNKNWKQKSNIGHVNNQNFVQIPLETLRWMITYKAESAGLIVVEQEESYTSKASLVDGDEIPVYGKETEKPVSFSGRRIKRGLYRTGSGQIINADLNGAGNILRKYIPDIFTDRKDSCPKLPGLKQTYSRQRDRSRVNRLLGEDNIRTYRYHFHFFEMQVVVHPIQSCPELLFPRIPFLNAVVFPFIIGDIVQCV